MTSLDPLERVVSTLARDPNLPRVKKLLYCACYGVWEDNTARLNQVSLQEIVQGVWERSPTLEALQFQLNRVVKTLNKPVAYAHLANGVLQVLNELYFDTYDITRPVTVNRVQFPLKFGRSIPEAPRVPAEYDSGGPLLGSPPLANAASEPPATQWFVGGQPNRGQSTLTPAQLSAQTAVRAHVLQSLSQHREQRRMKKLLVCVCHNQWENNRAQLEALDWELLLDDARQLMPTPQGLEHVLQAIVNSLSKPVEYRQVAQQLLEIVTPLYEQERPDETQFFGVTPEPNARVGEQHPGQRDYPGPGYDRNTSRTGPSQAGPTYSPAPSPFRAPAPPGQSGLTDSGRYGGGRSGAQPARRASDVFSPALGSPALGSPATGQGHYSGQHHDSGQSPYGDLHRELAESDGNDGPPTGLFAPQLPVSPMDQKYPPRALPNGGGYAGDAQEERTGAIAPGEQNSTRQFPPVHPRTEPGGGNVYPQAQAQSHPQIWEERGRERDSPPLPPSPSATDHGEEAEQEEFTLRLSLMRYANPLMAKVVIFSALHRLFRFSEQDWIDLRHHSLASLMAELEQRYPNLIDLEMKLCGVAEQLEVPEQAMQTVAALLKVLKPRYDDAQQAPARDRELAIASQAAPRPVGAQPFNRAEKATAIQFGPDGEAIAHQTAIADPEAPAQPVIAEIVPSDAAACEALISDDLEADLALLAASLEDDGLPLSHDS